MVHKCSVLGAILIVIGLYSVLWGKHKERKEELAAEEIPDPVKGIHVNGNTASVTEDLEANDQVELQKAEANNKITSVAIRMSVPAEAKVHQQP